VSSIDLWYTTRATGIAALVLLTATVLLGVLTAGRAKSTLPAFARADIHRRLSALTVVFLAIHVLTSVLDTYVNISWTAIVLPFSARYHTLWLALGTISVDLFLAVAITSALRRHISARAWRLVHWLAYASWPVAVAHSLGMGTDTRLTWVLGLVAACIASVTGCVGWRVASATRARAGLPRTVVTPRGAIRSRVSAPMIGREAV
jgi:methionine sulfoxide reductase heme-binding subunit